jgi:hypothetical protein
MLTRDDVLQMTALFLAYNFNILYDSLQYVIPIEESVSVFESEFQDMTYQYYFVKLFHMVYMGELIKPWETPFNTVIVKYRGSNSKIYKNATFSDILETINLSKIQQTYVQKPCIGITLKGENETISLPTNIFRDHTTDNRLIDIIAFHLGQHRQDWTTLELQYIGKTVTFQQDNIETAVIQDILTS